MRSPSTSRCSNRYRVMFAPDQHAHSNPCVSDADLIAAPEFPADVFFQGRLARLLAVAAHAELLIIDKGSVQASQVATADLRRVPFEDTVVPGNVGLIKIARQLHMTLAGASSHA